MCIYLNCLNATDLDKYALGFLIIWSNAISTNLSIPFSKLAKGPKYFLFTISSDIFTAPKSRFNPLSPTYSFNSLSISDIVVLPDKLTFSGILFCTSSRKLILSPVLAASFHLCNLPVAIACLRFALPVSVAFMLYLYPCIASS